MVATLRFVIWGGGDQIRARQGAIWPLVLVSPLFFLILFGLAFTVLPAFNYLPSLGHDVVSLDAWVALFSMPGIKTSIWLSLVTGFQATGISLAFALLLLGWAYSGGHSLAVRCCGAILAMPHAALAIGLAFLLAPSGWIIRLLAAGGVDIDRPLTYAFPADSYGLALLLALVIKETPFLFLVGLVALDQIHARQYLRIAQSLGYGSAMAWVKIIVPLLYRQIRWPIFAVLAYSLSVVDMSILLGPGQPPTFSVRVLQWINDPDLEVRFAAATGSLLQAALVFVSILLWGSGAYILGKLMRPTLGNGKRTLPSVIFWILKFVGFLLLPVLCLLAFGSILVLALWLVAGSWPFPQFLPNIEFVSLAIYVLTLSSALSTSLTIALYAVFFSVILALACLESGRRSPHEGRSRGIWVVYMPLVIPELSFVFGLAIFSIFLGLDGSLPMVVVTHMLFVFPYIYLALVDPWDHLDPRYMRAAQSLGASPWRVFWAIKIPLLKSALTNAAAIGFAVSMTLYVPTVLTGAGRISTLATEAVQLSSAGDRRITALFALTQCVFIWAAFYLAHRFGRARKIA